MCVAQKHGTEEGSGRGERGVRVRVRAKVRVKVRVRVRVRGVARSCSCPTDGSHPSCHPPTSPPSPSWSWAPAMPPIPKKTKITPPFSRGRVQCVYDGMRAVPYSFGGAAGITPASDAGCRTRERARVMQGGRAVQQHSVGGPPRQMSNSTLYPAVLAPSEMLEPHPQLPDLPLAR